MLKVLAAAALAAMVIQVASAGSAPSFQVGQRWSIKGSGMQIVIGRIDQFSGGKTAISISVFDVPCPPAMGCTTTTMAHAPFESQALEKSVDKLLATNAATAPEFEAGYANWQRAKGGIFTISVTQLPEVTFQTIEHGQRR